MIDFWKMAGIQTHLSDIDSGVSSNNAYRSISKMKTFLSFLNPSGPGNGGPFIFRDDVAFGDAGGDAVNQIGALGYKFVLYLGYGGAVSWNWNNQATRMQAAVDAGHVYAVEGPNEVVNFGLGSYTALDGKTYTGGLAGAHWQMDLYNTYHSQKNCFGETMPVIIMSYGTGSPQAAIPYVTEAAAAGINIADYADWSNVHSYMNWAWPFGAKGGSYGGQTQLEAEANNETNAPGFSSKPKAGTEMGLQHELGNDGNKWGTRHTYALLLPQLYLDSFKRGWAYVASYEGTDRNTSGAATNEKPGTGFEDVWGWSDLAGLPYEVAVVVRWMAGLTVDQGANKMTFFPGNLNVNVSNLSGDGGHLWFQKSDGTVVGFLWDNAPVYSNSGGSPGGPIDVATKSVSIAFGATYGHVSVYEPNLGAEKYVGSAHTGCPATPTATKSGNNVSSLTVDMSDHIVMVVIDP